MRAATSIPTLSQQLPSLIAPLQTTYSRLLQLYNTPSPHTSQSSPPPSSPSSRPLPKLDPHLRCVPLYNRPLSLPSLYTHPAHQIPTRWGLYRGLLRATKDQPALYAAIRHRARRTRILTDLERVQEVLREGYEAMEFLEKRSPGRLEQQSSKTSTSTPTPSTTLPSTSPSSSAPPTSAPPQAISSSPPTDYTPDERRYLLRLRLAGKSAYKRKWHAGALQNDPDTDMWRGRHTGNMMRPSPHLHRRMPVLKPQPLFLSMMMKKRQIVANHHMLFINAHKNKVADSKDPEMIALRNSRPYKARLQAVWDSFNVAQKRLSLPIPPDQLIQCASIQLRRQRNRTSNAALRRSLVQNTFARALPPHIKDMSEVTDEEELVAIGKAKEEGRRTEAAWRVLWEDKKRAMFEANEERVIAERRAVDAAAAPTARLEGRERGVKGQGGPKTIVYKDGTSETWSERYARRLPKDAKFGKFQVEGYEKGVRLPILLDWKEDGGEKVNRKSGMEVWKEKLGTVRGRRIGKRAHEGRILGRMMREYRERMGMEGGREGNEEAEEKRGM